MSSKFGSAPLTSGDVHIQISCAALLVPGFLTGVRGYFAHIGHALDKTFADEALQIALQQQKIPFVTDGPHPITVRACLVQVIERTDHGALSLTLRQWPRSTLSCRVYEQGASRLDAQAGSPGTT